MTTINTQKTFKVGYYVADIVNGITYYGDILDDPDIDVLTHAEFYEELDTLLASVVTFIDLGDEEFFNKLNTEYGVN